MAGYKPFKMKGNPFKRNYGIGAESPAKNIQRSKSTGKLIEHTHDYGTGTDHDKENLDAVGGKVTYNEEGIEVASPEMKEAIRKAELKKKREEAAKKESPAKHKLDYGHLQHDLPAARKMKQHNQTKATAEHYGDPHGDNPAAKTGSPVKQTKTVGKRIVADRDTKTVGTPYPAEKGIYFKDTGKTTKGTTEGGVMRDLGGEISKRLSNLPFYSKERIEAYKRKGWAMDHTTHKSKGPKKTGSPAKKLREGERKTKKTTRGSKLVENIAGKRYVTKYRGDDTIRKTKGEGYRTKHSKTGKLIEEKQRGKTLKELKPGQKVNKWHG
jgi:hypothetical protein